MDKLEALVALRDKVKADVDQRKLNARNAGKEGKGTHRNAGDAGRVARLWMEAVDDLRDIEALIAQEPKP